MPEAQRTQDIEFIIQIIFMAEIKQTNKQTKQQTIKQNNKQTNKMSCISHLHIWNKFNFNFNFNFNFIMKVTDLHSSCLDRQVTERVYIENFQGPILMNRRNEMGGVRVERMRYRRWGGD